MYILAVSVALVLVCFAAIHSVCAAAALRWKAHREVDPNFRPSAAVILAVRGSDPSLAETLLGLIHQDYDPLQIHIVVDHPTDPAWSVIRDIVKDYDSRGRCRVQILESPTQHCGLKCASIAQAVRRLGEIDVVATIDADVAPHATWLKELIAPLADNGVGVATGNHWFEPNADNCGSLLRSLWNAGALIPTSFFANPWGGSCAMRLADIQHCGLLEAWEKSVVDDGPIRQAYSRLNRRIVFLPSLIMLNRESCSLGFCVRYIARILTWSRVYESAFRWTVAHWLVNLTPLVFALGLLVASFVWGDWKSSLVLVFGVLGHTTLMGLSYLLVRTAVGRMAKLRGVILPQLSWSKRMMLFALIPMAFGVYTIALGRALRARFVCWRGAWYYLIHGSQVIRLTDRPFSAAGEGAASKVSI